MLKAPPLRRFKLHPAGLALLVILPTAAVSADTEQLDLELERKLEEFDRTIGRQNGADEVDILSQKGRNMPLDHGSAFDEVELGELTANSGIGSEDDTIAGRASGGSGMESSASSPGPEVSGDPRDTAAGSASGDANTGPSGSGGTGGGDQASAPLPDDIDEGQGDDIVLRQIREAAMREQDPQLRDKLWDEYRRIKGQ